jgi:hypothetical protein
MSPQGQSTSSLTNSPLLCTGNYVFLLGAYRGLYLLNWVYRYLTEPRYRQWIVWVSGLVQVCMPPLRAPTCSEFLWARFGQPLTP